MCEAAGEQLIVLDEAYIHFTEGLVDDQGNVTNTDTREFLQAFMTEFDEHTRRVLQVLPPK